MAQTLILAKSITEANRYARLVGLQRFTYRAVRSAGSIRGIRHAEVHVLPSFLVRPDRHAILAALKYARTLEVFYVDPADFAEPVEDQGDGMGPQLTITDVLNQDLRDVQDRVDQDIKDLAAVTATPPIFDGDAERRAEAERMVSEGAPDYALPFREPTPFVDHFSAEHGPESGRPQDFNDFEEEHAPSGEAQPVEDAAPAEEEVPATEPAPQPRKRRTRCKDCGALHYKDEPCVETPDDFFS